MLIWICAMHCEAKPVIDFYRAGSALTLPAGQLATGQVKLFTQHGQRRHGWRDPGLNGSSVQGKFDLNFQRHGSVPS